MSDSTSRRMSLFQGALLILGTSVGGGMLGLPVITSSGGFVPSCVMLALSWFFMTISGLVLAELACRMKHNANLVSIYSTAFPKFGPIFSTIIYIVLFYSLMIAYILALSNMVAEAAFEIEGIVLSRPIAAIMISSCAGFVILKMRSWLSWTNTMLVICMAIAYFFFLEKGREVILRQRLFHFDWKQAWSALPLIFTSFGFQGTVPSVARLMQYQKKPIFLSIILGTTATLIIYLLWQAVIIGSLPLQGYMSLEYAKTHGLDAIAPLAFHLPKTGGSTYLLFFGKVFAAAAVATSLLGVSVGMHDFVADILRIQSSRFVTQLFLVLLCFIPATICSLLYPAAFLSALSIAGGIGCASLLGVMPAITALYVVNQETKQENKEEKKDKNFASLRFFRWVFHPILLGATLLFFAIEIAYECLQI